MAQNQISDVSKTSIGIIIPTLNAENYFAISLPLLLAQGVPPHDILIIDSSSNDATMAMAREAGLCVETIERKDFNHGGTRARAAQIMRNHDILVFLTQDAIPASSQSIPRLVAPFADTDIALTYGRQLARPQAHAIERHARLFNYPNTSHQSSWEDRHRLGIKTIFCSNSFAAYRTRSLMEVGNFPKDTLFAEDQITADRILIKGWKTAYVADAVVYHSHDYSILQEFRRYFDVGVFHARNPQLWSHYGRAEGEGGRFIHSELHYLIRHSPWTIPQAFVRNAAKYLGYRTGTAEAVLPASWKSTLSMQPSYWRLRKR